MTKDNSKKLYNHYVEIGYDKAAEDMLAKYPEFKTVSKPKEEAPAKEAKPKKVK